MGAIGCTVPTGPHRRMAGGAGEDQGDVRSEASAAAVSAAYGPMHNPDLAERGEPEDRPSGGSLPRIRILLADDHAIVRESLARLLQMHEGLEVVGQAGDGQEAVERALDLKPDLIVMDVSMPRLNGIQATHRIKQILPTVLVIGLSMHTDADMAAAMRAAGACHYLTKTAAPDELVNLIRACFPG